jgi:hypothetical protein
MDKTKFKKHGHDVDICTAKLLNEKPPMRIGGFSLGAEEIEQPEVIVID